ncbi:MAG: type II toxin-antitoxin system ParD family antitoxin [Sutterellaceae bacterium]|nr:type II toxin-antitoxin system ParD family antitoxin [Sutterellaceae bacterium]
MLSHLKFSLMWNFVDRENSKKQSDWRKTKRMSRLVLRFGQKARQRDNPMAVFSNRKQKEHTVSTKSSILVPGQQAFVNEKISIRKYSDSNQVATTDLRLTASQEKKNLRAAIEIGLSSGIALNFDPERHLARLKQIRAAQTTSSDRD